MSTADDATVTWLTQEAHDRLSRELDELIANRAGVSKEINDRREEGDLKENGGYHAAKEEQGKQEGRILQLQALLRAAAVDAPVSDGVAGPGMVVKVRFEGDDDVETFLIGSREENETAGVAVYSAASPLGKALSGAREGNTVSYATPTGKHHEGHARVREALHRLTALRRSHDPGPSARAVDERRLTRCAIGLDSAITVEVRTISGNSVTRSSTCCRSSLDRATRRHSMSPWPVIVCTSSTSGIERRCSSTCTPRPCRISRVANAVTR